MFDRIARATAWWPCIYLTSLKGAANEAGAAGLLSGYFLKSGNENIT